MVSCYFGLAFDKKSIAINSPDVTHIHYWLMGCSVSQQAEDNNLYPVLLLFIASGASAVFLVGKGGGGVSSTNLTVWHKGNRQEYY